MKMMNAATGATRELPENLSDIMFRMIAGQKVHDFEHDLLTDFVTEDSVLQEENVELESEPCVVCTLLDRAATATEGYNALMFAKAARTAAEAIATMARLGE